MAVARPLVKGMLIDIEKCVAACRRGDLSLEDMQGKLHFMAAIMGVELSDGRALS